MSLGTGTSSASAWMTGCVLSLAVALLAAGCDVLDRSKLTLIPRPAPDGDMNGPPDAGPMMDGGMMSDGSTPPIDSGMPPIDSGMRPTDSSTPDDSSAPDDAASDASDDAEVDAGCGGGGCVDLCPNDDTKTEPGECGCGVAETNAAACSALRAALRHRYRFNGTGTVVTDEVSDADGTVMNATLDGSGSLTLSGGTSNQYVELPDGIISALTDATFEAWVTWQGGGAWQRILDFGNSSGTNGDTYIFATPHRGGGTGSIRSAISLAGGGGEAIADGTAALGTGAVHHMVVVVDDLVDLRVYVDGVLQTSVANTTRSLSALNDIQNWLGRSQYSADEEFNGSFHEFRIYDAALTAEQVSASFALGADGVYLEPFRGGLNLSDTPD